MTLAELFWFCIPGTTTNELRVIYVCDMPIVTGTTWSQMGLHTPHSNVWNLTEPSEFIRYWTKNFPSCVTEEDKAAMEPYFSRYLLGE